VDVKPTCIGVEAFYCSPAEVRAQEAELPPAVLETMREVNAGIDQSAYPSLRLRVFADFDDGSRLASDGSSMAVLLAFEDDARAADEESLRAAAWNAAKGALLDDDWLPELSAIVAESGHSVAAHLAGTRREARIDEESVRAAAR
jgi:hypothetical protein